MILLTNNQAGSKRRFELGIGLIANYMISFANYYSKNPYSTISKVVVNDNDWHHVLVTTDRYTTKMWVDGNIIAEESRTIDYLFEENLLRIGWTFDNTRRYTGLMQDIRVYNRILTDEEIIALYNE